MAYIGMPLLFACIGYLLLYIAGTPIWTPVYNTLQMISREDTVNIGINAPSIDHYTGNEPAEEETPVDSINASKITFPKHGDRYGQILIEDAGVDAPLYFGDADWILQKGVGQYIGSSYPGCGSTVLVSGHNNAHFNALKNVKVGQVITLKTNYGIYTYTVNKTAVVNVSGNRGDKAYDLAAKEENLVLYTCYPFDMLGLTPNRFFVYATLSSGPQILLDR